MSLQILWERNIHVRGILYTLQKHCALHYVGTYYKSIYYLPTHFDSETLRKHN